MRTILFDLDGTLLPMDQDVFGKAYFGGMAKKMVPYGYDPQRLVKAIWTGTEAMVKNDGSVRNDDAFWACFAGIFGPDVRKDEPIFEEYYYNEFQQVRQVCGFNPEAGKTVKKLKEMGFRLVLATNPLFPAIATQSRAKWAGLDIEDFDLITTYENSSHCKPNPDYYREILDSIGARAEDCLMVGNDALEDMVAEKVGMQVFLLTPHLINKHQLDISRYPQGDFSKLLEFVGNWK